MCSLVPGRAPSPEELSRIRESERLLARSALWARTLAFFIPAALGAGTFVLSLTTYPGALPEKVLVSVLQPVVFACAFTLPVLLTATGRTLSWHRRMRKDADGGFAVAHAHGEVTWNNRAGSYMATIHGARAISPFFTIYAKIPSFWERFDTLAPGPYAFDLLPESCLVLSARAIEPESPATVDAPLDVALRRAFGNRQADLEANRGGRASGAQRWRLVLARWWALLGVPVLTIGTWGALRNTWEAPGVGAVFAALVAVALTAFVVVLVARILVDASTGQIDSVVGIVRVRFGRSDATGSIGSTEFTLSSAQGRAMEGGSRYRVYVFRRSRIAAAAEPEDLPQTRRRKQQNG